MLIKEQQREQGAVLSSLTKNSEFHKADFDSILHITSEISGDVKTIKKDMSRLEVATADNWSDIARLKAVK